MDITALQFCARFALSPNTLGYCGSKTANLKDCIEKGNCDHVKKEIKKFIVLWPYLKTISEITGLDPFSYEVIEAYWLGNDLLKKVKNEDYEILLKNFIEQGVPKWLVSDLKKNPPKKFIPNHTFQVLFVGVGRASGAVPFNRTTVNKCLITGKGKYAYHWGEKIKSLTADEQKNLAFWTKEVVSKVAPLPKA
jgi:hypothetical protein